MPRLLSAIFATVGGWYCHFHFPDQELKLKEAGLADPGSHRQYVVGLDFESQLGNTEACVLSLRSMNCHNALGTWAWASSGRLEKFGVEPTTTKLYGMDNSSLCVSVSSFVKRVTVIPS